MIAVVHLVWGPLGTRPLSEFLRSYRAHPAGAEHELVVLFNDVAPEQREALQAELEGLEHRLLAMPTPMQDLAAYAYAARALRHERLCVLNSYSVILAEGWLAKLEGALAQPRAGIVGATGSWMSMRSAVMDSLFLPTPYREAIPARRLARTEYRAMDLEREGLYAQGVSAGDSSSRFATSSPRSRARRLGARTARRVRTLARWVVPIPEQLLRFQSFPAPHMRTNAFMVQRGTFAGLRIGAIRRKIDAHALESGRASITRQMQGLGLRALVVGRDGACYESDRWPSSRTFWQGEQEGLLVADNQTDIYANGGIDRRRLLSALAWGHRADPSLPTAAAGHDR